MLGNVCKAVLATGILLTSFWVYAHTGLKETVPAADAMVSKAPETVELVFSGPVRLIRLQVMLGDTELMTDFKPNSEPTASFSIKVAAMQTGKITVSWAAMGADGHTLSDDFSFTVDSLARGNSHRNDSP